MEQITVTIKGTECTIWFRHLQFQGFCGKNGASDQKQEGDFTTPLGIFPIYYGFYLYNRPHIPLPMVRLTPFHHFIDDQTSGCYNRLVYGIPHHTAEAMTTFPKEYAYGLVVEYNRNPTVLGKGSAIFVHCGNHPTAGCIALPKEQLLCLLSHITQKDLCIHIKKHPKD